MVLQYKMSHGRQVDLSYLLKHLSDDHSPRFCIDRTHRCTPRRNAQVEELFGFFGGLVPWATGRGRRFDVWFSRCRVWVNTSTSSKAGVGASCGHADKLETA